MFTVLPTPCVTWLLGRKPAAGFPSPADDFIEGQIDLSQFLIQHPAATFVMKVAGESMTGAGIHDGDYVLVDRSIEAIPGKIIVCVLDGELTIKRLDKTAKGQWQLVAEHPDYPPILLDEENPPQVWGVVTGCVRRYG
ncbi:MAG: peptidase S24 [Legionellales bacterium]|nr:peptidase S24 [Legionellales bacterium]